MERDKLDIGVYSVGSKAVVFANSKFAKGITPKNIIEGNNDICFWGVDNLLPQRFLDTFKKVDAAIAGFEVLVSAHYGNGFKLFKEIVTEKGNVDYQQIALSSESEIRDFFKRVKWGRFQLSVINDFEDLGVSFVEYLLSPNQEKVISVKRHQAPWCRFSKPKDKSGFIEKVFINSDWENYNKDYTVEIPCVPDFLSAEEVKAYVKEKKYTNFIIPVMKILDDEKVYPTVGWHSAFYNGWVETVLSVPEFKKYMFENQLHFKYIVYVSDEFMTRKYGNEAWQDFSPGEKEEKRKELVDKIDDHMSGNKAAGRSLTSPYFKDENGNLIKGIEVVPVDDKMKDGSFLPDAAAGNSQILFAQGIDPSIVGAGIPGGKSLSGSGSDKREAYTILGTRQPMKRLFTLEVFNFLRDYNSWNPDLIGNFPNQVLTTLDKETSGRTEVTHQ